MVVTYSNECEQEKESKINVGFKDETTQLFRLNGYSA